MRPWLAALALSAGVAVVASCARPGDSADDQQRWLLVNYWAVWCAPCRHEIPELNRLAAVTGLATDGSPPVPFRCWASTSTACRAPSWPLPSS